MHRSAVLFVALASVLSLGSCDGLNAGPASDAERVHAWVEWLADDAREGRGVGTEGLVAAETWLAERFEEIGLEPVGDDGYFQTFEVPVEIEVGTGTTLTLAGAAVDAADYVVASFSSSGDVEAEVVTVGYGITAEDLTTDDYAEKDVEGKIVAVRRFVPAGARFEDASHQRRYGDMRYKAFNAREHGAVGVLIVDLPELAAGEEMPDEAVLPDLKVDAEGDAGLPVLVLRREVGRALFDAEDSDAPLRAHLKTEVTVRTATARNVLGRVPAGSEPAKDGAILVGAHFDHLGFGGSGSLDPDVEAPHNGADDNASGTAGLLEIARELMAARDRLQRNVWIAAFSGEESGLVGSTTFTRKPTSGLDLDRLVAMVNLDMIGRLDLDRLSVLGGDSAAEWSQLVPPLCEASNLDCQLGGDGYGPSDQTPFYAAGVPVLHFFTGAHDDYHRTTDDADKVNSAGIDRIADGGRRTGDPGRRARRAADLHRGRGACVRRRHAIVRCFTRHHSRLRRRRPRRRLAGRCPARQRRRESRHPARRSAGGPRRPRDPQYLRLRLHSAQRQARRYHRRRRPPRRRAPGTAHHLRRGAFAVAHSTGRGGP